MKSLSKNIFLFLKNRSSERGFTELYAILIGSLILSIGLAILNITLKEFLLSSSARESQIAFFAADAGSECALYWDLTNPNGSAFLATTNGSGLGYTNISCNGQNFHVGRTPKVSCGLNCERSTFSLTSPVASVTIDKTTNPITTAISTVIDSKGYNTSAGTQSRVERAIRVQY